MAVAVKVKEKFPDRDVIGHAPMHSSSSNGAAERAIRGGDGVSAYRAAYDRDYTQELVPFGETVMYKEPVPAHSGLRGGRRQHRGGTA